MEGSGSLSDLSTGGLSCHSGSLFYLTFLALLLVMSCENPWSGGVAALRLLARE